MISMWLWRDQDFEVQPERSAMIIWIHWKRISEVKDQYIVKYAVNQELIGSVKNVEE